MSMHDDIKNVLVSEEELKAAMRVLCERKPIPITI